MTFIRCGAVLLKATEVQSIAELEYLIYRASYDY